MIVINQMTGQLNSLRDPLTSVLEVNGINVSQLVAKNQQPEPAQQLNPRLDEKRPKKK